MHTHQDRLIVKTIVKITLNFQQLSETNGTIQWELEASPFQLFSKTWLRNPDPFYHELTDMILEYVAFQGKEEKAEGSCAGYP